MSSLSVPSRPPVISVRALAVFTALTTFLIAGFVVGPRLLAADRSVGFANESQLTAAARDAFVGYWHSGARDFPSALDQIVDYWMRYHVAKAVIAAILFVVVASALDEIRQQLSVGAHESPAIDVMVSDFARYHAIMAGIAGAVGVGLVVTSVVFWRELARSTDRRTKRVLGSFGAIALLCALSMIVVAVANTMTAADPVPALLALLEGGW